MKKVEFNSPNGSRLWFLIKQDGSKSSKQTLYVEDKRKREELIMDHFRKAYKDRYQIEIPERLISRDNPEDFVFQNDSELIIYPVEIVSISDLDNGFKKTSNQILIEKIVKSKLITNSIYAYVPTSSSKAQIIQELDKIDDFPMIDLQNINKSVEIMKLGATTGLPVFRKTTNNLGKIFMTYGGTIDPLVDIVNGAIKAKENKNYPRVAQMTLIIDDQTTKYTRSDFEEISPQLITQNADSPFNEIFIYSGLYIDDSGQSRAQSEFILYPIKSPYDNYVLSISNQEPALSGSEEWIKFLKNSKKR